MSTRRQKYIDLKSNSGKLFPSWVLKNFKKYKLPEIIIDADEDPCNRAEGKLEMRKYQEFLTKYMDYNSPHHDILVYHGLGSGKTSTAINIYNMLYNYTPGWNVFIIIKATLKTDTWLKDLDAWLGNERDHKMKNITFISYDSPIADKQFLEAVKNADSSKKNLYIFDEAHNFIRNVYTNINSRQGKRAQVIYDYIINDKKENEGVRVVLLSGTPAINYPYELALLFNLLRPGTFPKSEAAFNQLYVTTSGYPKINDATKNMFQRRILGLVSYYYGATADLYASKTTHYIDVPMSDYQADMYTFFEEIEERMSRQKKANKGGSETYMSYTRQSANFVFPQINQWITGESRPRPNKFKIEETDSDNALSGKSNKPNPSNPNAPQDNQKKQVNVSKYLEELGKFVDAFDDYLEKANQDDKKASHTLIDDLKTYTEKYSSNYAEFHKNEKKKSSLYEALHKSSAKMLYMVFNIMKSRGPVLVYSNYVLVEGLQLFKVYLKAFGFSSYKDRSQGVDNFRYTEYHGMIDSAERTLNLRAFNTLDNSHGKIIKIIMISPAGAEGLSLKNTVQVHIMEPYWHEVRITQMIGRAIRQCSHKDLPMEERHVDVFRYKSVRKSGGKNTADQIIENIARSKEGLIQSFLDAIKEAAVDCVLNKNHNMMTQEYKCFQFNEPSLFETPSGPAYKTDVLDDIKFNNGLNDENATTLKLKVMKIKAVIQTEPESENVAPKISSPQFYWYNKEYGTVYDFDLHYPIGSVAVDIDNIPIKVNEDTYLIDKLLPIPILED